MIGLVVIQKMEKKASWSHWRI